MSFESGGNGNSDKPGRGGSSGSKIGAGIAIGAGVGVALGTALDNLALGLAIGIAIGTSIGAALAQSEDGTAMESDGPGRGRLWIVLGLGLAVLAGLVTVILVAGLP